MLKQPALGGRRPLVQFRAGKMTYRDGMVYPEATLGLVTVVQGSGMVDVIWTGSGKPDEMSVITRGSAQFNRVDKCTTGRVFVLQLNGSSTNPSQCRFFWMQDPNEDKDADVLRKVRAAIGDREDGRRGAGAAARGATATSEQGPISASAFQSILNNLGQPPAASSSVASPTSPSVAGATTGSSTAASLATTLQSLQQSQAGQNRLSLQAMLSSDELRAALQEDPEYYLRRLESQLPPPPPSSGQAEGASRNLLDEVRNPQASSAAATLQAALSDSPAAFREVCTAFGLAAPPGSAPGAFEAGAAAFIRRIQATSPPESTGDDASTTPPPTQDGNGAGNAEE